jgi:hypothetical protein
VVQATRGVTSRATLATSTRSSASDWCLDSGSYYHYTNDMNDFVDNKYVAVDSGVMVGDSRILKGHTLSNVILPVKGIDSTTTEITFTDVLYTPYLTRSLSPNAYYVQRMCTILVKSSLFITETPKVTLIISWI